jgi:hypothetical protein
MRVYQVGERVIIWPSPVDVLEATVTQILDYDQVKVTYGVTADVIDTELVFPLSNAGRRELAKAMMNDARYMMGKAGELLDEIEE